MKYSDSGVDIDKASRGLASAGAALRSSWNERVLSKLGAYGGLFDIAGLPDCAEPILVSSIDGVGTKLKLAFATGRHDSVGACLVNHCVNDILVQGARPLFFLDYFATGCLEEGVLADVIAGMAGACRENGCALIGGETAEMPDFYPAGEYDLAGCIVGVVDRQAVVTGETIRPGDLLLGFASTGLHTNGYSLARKVLLEQAALSLDEVPAGLDRSLADALLAVHRSYLPQVMTIGSEIEIKGMVHLTGGAFTDNIPRILPEGCRALVDISAWETPPLFELIAELGQVERSEMYRVFNMGVGFILVIAPEDLPCLEALAPADYIGPLGRVAAGAGPVELSG